MSDEFEASLFPELVVGIAGPIGIDIDEIAGTLDKALKGVGYSSSTIRITDEIASETTSIELPTSSDFYDKMVYKMDHASEVCRRRQSADTLMRIAIRAIRRERGLLAEAKSAQPGQQLLKADDEPEDQVQARHAFIIRQLKRPEEVNLLRKVYGKQFILVSAYGSIESRKAIIETKIRRSAPLNVADHDISHKADMLIDRDANENADAHGQHLRETFHLADVFIDGIQKSAMTQMSRRFVEALFGRNDVAPSKAEYGMYAAKAASFRSSDLSRQVGAAAFSPEGEIIAQGCNEVPKAFGGTYWDGESPDFRDVKLGHDPNDILKKEVIRDFLERLENSSLLSPNAKKFGDSASLVEALITKKSILPPMPGQGALVGAKINDLTEYGRVVHAEMSVVCDAARLGKPLKGATLYVTTFPCHNCTKHILGAGVARVVFMEPYPKSKAKELHENEVELEKESQDRVSFIPFLGISPEIYQNIFKKGKRKRDGYATAWYHGEPRPMIGPKYASYVQTEALEVFSLYSSLKKSSSTQSDALLDAITPDPAEQQGPSEGEDITQ
ncbi:MAG: anti-phage dCTP deaminase [Sphingomonas adhaesiva]|uniref:anti-phage dCTP deaminase n=1 Tax=Sphingomonas adhaesiva TaxID=28212 RepID=UPI002FF81FEA